MGKWPKTSVETEVFIHLSILFTHAMAYLCRRREADRSHFLLAIAEKCLNVLCLTCLFKDVTFSDAIIHQLQFHNSAGFPEARLLVYVLGYG